MSDGSRASTRIESTSGGQTSPDGLFETLKNSRRRAVLRYLLLEEDSASFRDLVQYVAALENETTPEAVSAAQRNRVRTALYQHHLGKLEEHGFINYDKREGTVSLNGNADLVRPYIRPEGETEGSPVTYLFGGVMIAVAALMVLFPSLNLVSAILVAGLGIGVIVYSYSASNREETENRGMIASISERIPGR